VGGELNSLVAVSLGKATDTHDTQGRTDPGPVWVLCQRKAPCPLLKMKLRFLSRQAHILVTTLTDLLCHRNESVQLKLSIVRAIHFILSEENNPVYKHPPYD